MEILLSAVAGELVGRSMSCLIDKYSKQSTTPWEEESLQRLQRVLLRARVAVEEAEGRRIMNRAMLQQLEMLRDEMHRGYYVLDALRFDGKNCPPLYRQPYSVHLFMDKCMFGRHVEMERLIGFLLQGPPPPGIENFEVLPIVGPGWVGKSTLVEHACIDERVRNHFSRIVLFSGDDLRNQRLTTLMDGGVTKYRNSECCGNGRLLVIIELAGDDDEGLWSRLHSASKSNNFPGGSKMIITSRHDKIASFGTTQALTLKPLSREAYWYFFKVLAFGSSDPQEQPKLAAIAMEIATELNGVFLAGNVAAELLRADANVQSWSRLLRFMRERIQKHLLLFGEHPIDLWKNDRSMYVRRMAANTGEDCLVSSYSWTGLGLQEEGQAARRPCKITSFRELLFGRAVPSRGRFELLGWKSHVPPCYEYHFACEIQKPEEDVLVRKNSISHQQKKKII